MNLKKILNKDSVKIGLPGGTKEEILENLVDMIVSAGKGLDRKTVMEAVRFRESQMSTGMKHGIAIPHGKTDSVDDLHAAIAVSAKPVDFDSLDKKPARIFVITISPEERTGPHLQFLAEVSGLLTNETLREKILAAKDEDELLGLFLGGKG